MITRHYYNSVHQSYSTVLTVTTPARGGQISSSSMTLSLIRGGRHPQRVMPGGEQLPGGQRDELLRAPLEAQRESLQCYLRSDVGMIDAPCGPFAVAIIGHRATARPRNDADACSCQQPTPNTGNSYQYSNLNRAESLLGTVTHSNCSK